jgi:hypothetical protein
MKSFIAGILLLLTLVGAANGADKREILVDQLLKPELILRVSNTYMTAYAREFVVGWKPTLNQIDEATEQELLTEFTARLVSDDMSLLPELRVLYLKHFTEEELQAMVDFFASPIGTRIIEKLDAFDRDLANIYYPGLNDKAIKHWYDSVAALRALGRKL